MTSTARGIGSTAVTYDRERRESTWNSPRNGDLETPAEQTRPVFVPSIGGDPCAFQTQPVASLLFSAHFSPGLHTENHVPQSRNRYKAHPSRRSK